MKCFLVNTFFTILLLVFSQHAAFGQVPYKNPIMPGFYPDPSICLVGDTYYLVNSSFGYFPGVPIFKSKNLVNWEQIGHVLNRASQLPLHSPAIVLGIFAPTIRYHNGVFYMITTNVPEKGNFYVTTKDPAGEWSDPVYIDMPGIDPSLFFDDDGKTYVTSTQNWGAVKNGIVLSEIDVATGKLLTKPTSIWHGTGGRFPEGPHIYKKDGYYYLLIAEGGTEYGHMVTMARSKTISGPYERNPQNPILTHRGQTAESNPIQGVGHADLVQAADGSWFMVMLGFRPNDSHQILGRETFLAPVVWPENEFPVVNGTGTIDLDMTATKLPAPTTPQLQDDQDENFTDAKLGFSWNFINNPVTKNYSLTERKGYLRVYGNKNTLSEITGVTFAGRRQQHFDFKTTVSLDFDPALPTEEAGVVLFKNELHHYKFYIKKTKNQRQLIIQYKLGHLNAVVSRVPLKKGPVSLQITGNKDIYEFGFSQKNEPVTVLGKMDTRYLSTETTGGFTGIYIGMYASGNGTKSKTPADFDFFTYKPKK